MRILRRLFISFTVVLNIIKLKLLNVSFNSTVRIRGIVCVQIKQNGVLILGDDFTMKSGYMLNPLSRNLKSMIRVDKGAKIVIGNNVGMSSVSLWSKQAILIEDNVKLGAGVIIIDSDMHALDYSLRRNVNTDSVNAIKQKVIIRKDAFVGVNSIVTKGVEIGERSIIAAGSVVVKSVPSDEIWGGNPAKFIKKINY